MRSHSESEKSVKRQRATGGENEGQRVTKLKDKLERNGGNHFASQPWSSGTGTVMLHQGPLLRGTLELWKHTTDTLQYMYWWYKLYCVPPGLLHFIPIRLASGTPQMALYTFYKYFIFDIFSNSRLILMIEK